jgi:hypothetical protein
MEKITEGAILVQHHNREKKPGKGWSPGGLTGNIVPFLPTWKQQ